MDPCTGGCCKSAIGAPLKTSVADDLAVGFKALGDRHRVAVIDLILRAGAPVCVVDIERHVPLAQSTVSYHLKALIDAGILDRERKGRWMYYTARPDRLNELQKALNAFIELS